MRRLLTHVALLAALLPCGAHAANPISYAINLGLGPVSNDSGAVLGQGQLTGTLVTDGTLGDLALSNIASWSFTFAIASAYSFTINSAGIAGPTNNSFLRGSVLRAGADDLRLVSTVFPTDIVFFTNGTSNVSFGRSPVNASDVVVSLSLPSASPVRNDILNTPFPYNTVIGTAVVTAVPEPAAWALMVAGLAGVAGVYRRRQRSGAVAAGQG